MQIRNKDQPKALGLSSVLPTTHMAVDKAGNTCATLTKHHEEGSRCPVIPGATPSLLKTLSLGLSCGAVEESVKAKAWLGLQFCPFWAGLS